MRGAGNRKRALLLYGGWEGHQPEQIAKFAADSLLQGLEITCSRDLGLLNADTLSDISLLLPIWTFGNLTDSQLHALLAAVTDGMGVVSWHGAASSFLKSRSHKFMLGGQFVGHPGGDRVTYRVELLANDPIVEGLEDFTVTSEQHYLLIDPAIKPIAMTSIVGPDMEWVEGVRMPVAWTRSWGKGRIFYCSLGHTQDVLEIPQVLEMLRRAVNWAAKMPLTQTQPERIQ